ncbi:MAG TPA: carboxypeptidase regulatory-like domain-containing protein [Bryobacteraceae bacterium]|nr:carboxypeptidase regulatory-like domain-containing protein [Bryobacteraceae bacterium]
MPVISAILSLCLLVGLANAQSASSTINGLVLDDSGGAVPDAKVTITNQGTGVKVETQTNNQGAYTMTGLPSGTYEVSITKDGLNRYTERDVFVGPTVVRSVNATLAVGSVSTTVTVEASTSQVQLTTPSVSNYVAQQQIEELPLNGRNYQSLSALMPGVLNTAVGQSQGQGGFNTGNTMSINGMGASGTLYELDGVWNMNTGNMTQTTITPNPDSIQEVRTLQSNIGPKYTLMGASIVLVQTRSGTSQFHGALWEYLRNDALDARNFFSPGVLPLKQNIFGGTLGGPVFIPKLYPRSESKTFFFFSEQNVRKSIASTIFGATPTQAMRSGIFNNRILDPTTGQPFPQNASGQYVIPQNRINSNSLVYLNAIAQLPNYQGSGFNNFLNATPEKLNQNDIQIKVDHNIGQKVHLMGEYFDLRQNDNLPSQTWLPSPFTTNTQAFFTRSKLAEAQATIVISPTMVNQITLGMNNYVVDLSVSGTVYKEQLPEFKSTLPYTGVLSNRLPQVNFSGGWTSLGIVQSLPLTHASDLENTLTDDWSWVKGKHTIEAGLNVVFSTKRQNIFQQTNGSWLFSGKFTGDPIADYLLGTAESFTQVNSQRRPYIHGTMVTPYFQDTFKVSKTLTLNYGVRLLHMPLPSAQPGYASTFDPSKYDRSKAPIVNATGTITPTPNYDPLNGLIFNGQNGVPQNFSDKHKWYFMPTFGFAYDPFGRGKTSIRGGFGETRARVFTGNDCTYACPANPPFLQNITLQNPLFPSPLGTGTATPPGAQNLSMLDFNNQAAAIYTYSLTFEQEVAGWLFSVGGVGNQVRHRGIALNLNQPLPVNGYDYPPDINTGTFRYVYGPYYGWGALNASTTTGNASWHGLLLSARHQATRGLFISGSYTYSHGIQEAFGSSFGSNGIQNSYNRRADRGNSSVNVPHIASSSWLYDIPFMTRSKGVTRVLLGGWKYNGIATFRSGISLNPGLSVANQGLATRPDVAPGQVLTYPKDVRQWFNTGAFQRPGFGKFGNAGPGILRGPSIMNFDMGLYKDFKFNERAKVQFRSEFFNVFNHTNFAGVNTTLGSGAYGQITSALDPRIIEFSLRLQY